VKVALAGDKASVGAANASVYGWFGVNGPVPVLLSVLNDALRQSPVLVQAYTADRSRPDTLDIPFPSLPEDKDTDAAGPAYGPRVSDAVSPAVAGPASVARPSP